MKKRYITENFFKVKLSQQHLPIATSGDPLEEFTIYLESVPSNSEGWIICDFNDSSKRDLIYYHSKTVNSITYYRKDRSNPTVTHKKSSYCQINNVDNFFNYLFDNVDDLGLVQDMGTNKVKILGGQCYYDKSFKTIVDSTITTLADGTWYAVLDYSDDTLKCVSSVDTDIHLKFATIVVASTDISSITDNRTTQLQSNKNVLDGLSEYGGNLMYNGVPIGGGAGAGDTVGPSSSVAENIVTFLNTTGKVIKDSGKSFENNLTNNNNKVPTGEAVSKAIEDTEAIINTKSDLIDNTFMLGETCAVGDSLFKEVGPTFAEATTSQNIGDVAGNTRVSIPVIGSGTEDNSLKLALAKVDALGEDLTLRIETDNAGEPSGTLVDDNAIATIARADLTTSLVDTSIALNTATTDNEHGVTLDNNELTQTNYKGIKFTLTSQVGMVSVDKVAACTATKAYLYNEAGDLLQTVSFVSNTATFNSGDLRNGQSYYILVGSDGSAYTSVKQTGSASFPYNLDKISIDSGYIGNVGKLDESHGKTFNSTSSVTQESGFRIYVKHGVKIGKITKSSTSTASRATLKNDGGTILATVNFVGDIADFGGYELVGETNYRIEVGANIQTYTAHTLSSTGYPVNGLNINYISGSLNGSSTSTNRYNITSIETEQIINQDLTGLNNITQIKTNGNILITEGTKYHIVLAQATDIVDPARYFKVGYSTNNTSTRGLRLWNATRGSAVPAKFCYTSSGLFANSLLSLTDATYSYKLPNDIPRFAKAIGAIGEYPKCSYKGIADLFTGLTVERPYFISDTPGAIGATAGTNSFVIGTTISNDKLLVGEGIKAGNNIVFGPTGNKTTASTTIVTLWDGAILSTGIRRIYFTLSVGAITSGPATIYRNGLPYGTTRTVPRNTSTEFIEDLYFKAGDTISIRGNASNGSYPITVGNVKIAGNNYNQQVILS